MKRNIQILSRLLSLIIIGSVFMMSCDDDDDGDINEPQLTGQSKTYNLASVSNPAISGTVKFEERSDDATVITIDLDGTTSGNSHPAHIHANSAAETGDIIIDLQAVDGATGKSETIVKEKKDGSSISYDQLLEIDGYINVHTSESDLATLIAQGDIGGNEVTGTFKSYTLSSINSSGITGVVTFSKRVNGTTLVAVDLDGASPTGQYPVYVYENDIITSGPVVIDLNTVNGSTGISYTNVTELNSGSAITYDELVDYNGHVKVNTSPTIDVALAQVNIGSNGL